MLKFLIFIWSVYELVLGYPPHYIVAIFISFVIMILKFAIYYTIEEDCQNDCKGNRASLWSSINYLYK